MGALEFVECESLGVVLTMIVYFCSFELFFIVTTVFLRHK